MTERTFEQVAEVEAILDAIRPHLHVGSEEEAGVLAGHVLIAKHPQLAREFGDALRRRATSSIPVRRLPRQHPFRSNGGKGTPSPPACRMDDPRGQHRRRPRPTGPQCRTAAARRWQRRCGDR